MSFKKPFRECGDGRTCRNRLAATYERYARVPNSMKVDPALARDYGIELDDAASFAGLATNPLPPLRAI
ncbi:MAG: hypothetical protein EDM03_09425 [Porphyrobacter sp. IPPAS B-1204]|nr:MAG: hypothetical protein EDM03_09425 [Porphyrobacter sp. IPPAS B-1204]